MNIYLQCLPRRSLTVSYLTEKNLNEGEFINIKLKSFLRLNDFITPRVLRCAIKSQRLYIMYNSSQSTKHGFCFIMQSLMQFCIKKLFILCHICVFSHVWLNSL